MDWKELRSKVWGLMAPNGLTGSIGNLVKLAFTFIIASVCAVGIPSIVYFVIIFISGFLAGTLGDSALVAILTGIFFLIAFIILLIGISLSAVGIFNMIKNFVMTGNLNFKDVFYGYQSDSKGLIIKTMVVYMLGTSIGAVLCFIPGVIFAILHMFVPLILTENPDMKVFEILKLSREMIKGHIIDYLVNAFILWLIALGASIIGCCTLGIAPLLAQFYAQAVLVAFYLYRVSEFEASNDDGNEYDSSDIESGDVF